MDRESLLANLLEDDVEGGVGTLEDRGERDVKVGQAGRLEVLATLEGLGATLLRERRVLPAVQVRTRNDPSVSTLLCTSANLEAKGECDVEREKANRPHPVKRLSCAAGTEGRQFGGADCAQTGTTYLVPLGFACETVLSGQRRGTRSEISLRGRAPAFRDSPCLYGEGTTEETRAVQCVSRQITWSLFRSHRT